MVAACYLGHLKNFLIDTHIRWVITVQQIFRSSIQPETPLCQQCHSCRSFWFHQCSLLTTQIRFINSSQSYYCDYRCWNSVSCNTDVCWCCQEVWMSRRYHRHWMSVQVDQYRALHTMMLILLLLLTRMSEMMRVMTMICWDIDAERTKTARSTSYSASLSEQFSSASWSLCSSVPDSNTNRDYWSVWDCPVFCPLHLWSGLQMISIISYQNFIATCIL